MAMLAKEATMSDGRAADDEDSDALSPLKKSVHFHQSSDDLSGAQLPPLLQQVSDDVFDSDSVVTSTAAVRLQHRNVAKLKHSIPGVCEIISATSDDSMSSPVMSRDSSPQHSFKNPTSNHVTSPYPARRHMPQVPRITMVHPARPANNGAHMVHRFRPPPPLGTSPRRAPHHKLVDPIRLAIKSPMAASVKTFHYPNSAQNVKIITNLRADQRLSRHDIDAGRQRNNNMQRSPMTTPRAQRRMLPQQPPQPPPAMMTSARRPMKHAQSPHVIRINPKHNTTTSSGQSLSQGSDDDSDGSYI